MSVEHAAGGHPTQSEPEIIHPAVARLEAGTEVVRRVFDDRPVLVASALLDGVTEERVTTAPNNPDWRPAPTLAASPATTLAQSRKAVFERWM